MDGFISIQILAALVGLSGVLKIKKRNEVIRENTVRNAMRIER